MASARPGYISFHITNRCDARCRHCRIWTLEEPPSPPAADFVRVIDEIAEWAGSMEIIIAGGEPLLSDKTFALLERAKKREMETVLVTNGFLIDDDAAHKLASAGLSFASVSLDGFDHIHDRIRNRPGAFNLVMRAIQALHKSGVKVRIGSVIMEDNLDQITGMIDFLARDGRVNGIYFQAMAQPFGDRRLKRGWWRTNPHFPRDTARVHALLDEILAMKQGGYFILNEDAQFPALKAYFADPDRFSMARCTVGDAGFTINAAGYVLLCTFMEPVGNIRDGRNIRQIFESEEAIALRSRMNGCDINCHLLINCSFDPSQLLSGC